MQRINFFRYAVTHVNNLVVELINEFGVDEKYIPMPQADVWNSMLYYARRDER